MFVSPHELSMIYIKPRQFKHTELALKALVPMVPATESTEQTVLHTSDDYNVSNNYVRLENRQKCIFFSFLFLFFFRMGVDGICINVKPFNY